MAFSCCFGLRGNLDGQNFLQKSFYNINNRVRLLKTGRRKSTIWNWTKSFGGCEETKDLPIAIITSLIKKSLVQTESGGLLAVWPVKNCQISIKVVQKWFHWFWQLYKNCPRMVQIWANYKALKSCPRSNKLPNLVTLIAGTIWTLAFCSTNYFILFSAKSVIM